MLKSETEIEKCGHTKSTSAKGKLKLAFWSTLRSQNWKIVWKDTEEWGSEETKEWKCRQWLWFFPAFKYLLFFHMLLVWFYKLTMESLPNFQMYFALFQIRLNTTLWFCLVAKCYNRSISSKTQTTIFNICISYQK